jgi:OOP family OmpA-OmpF porin
VFVGNNDKGRKIMNDLAATTACGSAKSADELATAGAMASFVEEAFLEKAPMKAAPAPAPLPQPKISWILSGVTFEFDSAVLRPESKNILQDDIQILKENPQIQVEVQGHTDDTGTAEYNMGLSDRRAKSVKDYLISQGIAASRLTAKGYGESSPRFPNDSEANRARNRRVELVPMN